MPYSSQVTDRNYESFRKDTSGKTSISVVNPDGTPIGTSSYSNDVLSALGEVYPNAHVLSVDNFDDGKNHGWSYHNQYNLSAKRYSPTLSRTAFRGNYSLAVYTPNVAGATAYARKTKGGFLLPHTDDGLRQRYKKLIIGTRWAWHAWWLRGLYRVEFGVDTQAYTNGVDYRQWFKVAWVRSLLGTSTVDNFWQYDADCADTPNFQAIPNGEQVIAWNEPYKEMWSIMLLGVDLENHRYDKLYSNGMVWDLTSLPVDYGTALPVDFEQGVNIMLGIHTRTGAFSASNMSALFLESPFIAYEN